ncbi:MAG: DNA gyrase subunit A, partial [bacterium]
MEKESNKQITNREEIILVDIEDQLKSSFLDYAMSIIISRALPDVRDGLKPVHRRILYAMYTTGNTHNKPFRKSARIAGDVIGRYHPHGEAAVYETIVRLAQDFTMRYPLVDGQGNFGSIDGDPPAAMRYTEIRMTRLAEELLKDIEYQTVDFVPNYDNTLTEPTVLPARFPNLLINGSAGIAVGMATNIPPHNLAEAIDATIKIIDNPDITIDELLKIMPGPDFPTGGIIHGKEGIRSAYQTGKGGIKVRAVAKIEELKGDKEAIVITEIPYIVNKSAIIEEIAEYIRNKKIESVSDIRDESDREGLRIVIEMKRGSNAQLLLNQLFKHTRLETGF